MVNLRNGGVVMVVTTRAVGIVNLTKHWPKPRNSMFDLLGTIAVIRMSWRHQRAGDVATKSAVIGQLFVAMPIVKQESGAGV
jgi:hypothetical protein